LDIRNNFMFMSRLKFKIGNLFCHIGMILWTSNVIGLENTKWKWVREGDILRLLGIAFGFNLDIGDTCYTTLGFTINGRWISPNCLNWHEEIWNSCMLHGFMVACRNGPSSHETRCALVHNLHPQSPSRGCHGRASHVVLPCNEVLGEVLGQGHSWNKGPIARQSRGVRV
jgi:hypothetical protein